jgi:hypothetical protein
VKALRRSIHIGYLRDLATRAPHLVLLRALTGGAVKLLQQPVRQRNLIVSPQHHQNPAREDGEAALHVRHSDRDNHDFLQYLRRVDVCRGRHPHHQSAPGVAVFIGKRIVRPSIGKPVLPRCGARGLRASRAIQRCEQPVGRLHLLRRAAHDNRLLLVHRVAALNADHRANRTENLL